MTILQALNSYYDRMAARDEADPPGYSREKISFAVVLGPDGRPIDSIDLRQEVRKKLQPRLMAVPAPLGTRTVAIAPNFLWDKTAYVFGRIDPEKREKRNPRKPERTPQEHAAFKAMNLELIGGSDDAGLAAFRGFLERWKPPQFDGPPFLPEMLDANFVFHLDGDDCFLHERSAARRLNEARTSPDAPIALCLVTGATAPIQRLHPTIRGVEGAQSSGAALISFNLEAFSSYGHEQGANAPTSQAAAFRYGTALNRMLDTGSANRLPRRIGDATVVFWADASGVGEEAAGAAEDWFARLFNADSDANQLDRDKGEAVKIWDVLRDVSAGRPMRDLDPRLSPGVRFHVLGLAPNAARLSVRYWLEDDFGSFALRLADHYRDLAIEPPPWRSTLPTISRLLVNSTALQEKFENIPPMLAGEMMRAVLSGTPYPRTLLLAAVARLRAGDNPETGWHAAAIRAVLARARRLHQSTEGVPVSLDRENSNPAYQLGRLFAALEVAQRLALKQVNATIRDRYFGAASAAPAGVFPLLLRGVQGHLGKLRKEGKGGWIEKELEEITDRLPPELPRALRLEAQGRFAIGYYHQRKAQFAGRTASDAPTSDTEEGDGSE